HIRRLDLDDSVCRFERGTPGPRRYELDERRSLQRQLTKARAMARPGPLAAGDLGKQTGLEKVVVEPFRRADLEKTPHPPRQAFAFLRVAVEHAFGCEHN